MRRSPPTPPRLELPAELRVDIGREPVRGNKTYKDCTSAWFLIPILEVVAVGFMIYALASGLTPMLAVTAIYAALIAAMYFSGKRKADKENAKQDAVYFAWLKKKNACDEARAKYNEQQRIAKQQWQKQRDEKMEEITDMLTAESQTMIAQSRAERRRIEESIAVLQSSYEQLLSMRVLHPKYQTMAACMTMLDYFETGRVSALMGPDGAYNLYESELRSNLIIDRLDEINESLKRIEKAMYTLVSAVRETNRHLKNLETEMKSLNATAKEQLDAQREIAHWSSVTAVCTEAAARNTEALKYIALANG